MKKPTKQASKGEKMLQPQEYIQYGLDVINIIMDMACILDDSFAKVFEKDVGKIIESIGQYQIADKDVISYVVNELKNTVQQCTDLAKTTAVEKQELIKNAERIAKKKAHDEKMAKLKINDPKKYQKELDREREYLRKKEEKEKREQEKINQQEKKKDEQKKRDDISDLTQSLNDLLTCQDQNEFEALSQAIIKQFGETSAAIVNRKISQDAQKFHDKGLTIKSVPKETTDKWKAKNFMSFIKLVQDNLRLDSLDQVTALFKCIIQNMLYAKQFEPMISKMFAKPDLSKISLLMKFACAKAEPKYEPQLEQIVDQISQLFMVEKWTQQSQIYTDLKNKIIEKKQLIVYDPNDNDDTSFYCQYLTRIDSRKAKALAGLLMSSLGNNEYAVVNDVQDACGDDIAKFVCDNVDELHLTQAQVKVQKQQEEAKQDDDLNDLEKL